MQLPPFYDKNILVCVYLMYVLPFETKNNSYWKTGQILWNCDIRTVTKIFIVLLLDYNSTNTKFNPLAPELFF